MQDLIREQPTHRKSINLIEQVVISIDRMTASMEELRDLKGPSLMIIQSHLEVRFMRSLKIVPSVDWLLLGLCHLQFLVEVLQGPCEQNQNFIIEETSLVIYVKRIMALARVKGQKLHRVYKERKETRTLNELQSDIKRHETQKQHTADSEPDQEHANKHSINEGTDGVEEGAKKDADGQLYGTHPPQTWLLSGSGYKKARRAQDLSRAESEIEKQINELQSYYIDLLGASCTLIQSLLEARAGDKKITSGIKEQIDERVLKEFIGLVDDWIDHIRMVSNDQPSKRVVGQFRFWARNDRLASKILDDERVEKLNVTGMNLVAIFMQLEGEKATKYWQKRVTRQPVRVEFFWKV